MIEETLREFITAGGEVIAFIHGHDHGDMISTVTDENGMVLWYEVCVACSRFHVPKGNGTPGMTFWERREDDSTMLIFDVVSVDLENRKVQFTSSVPVRTGLLDIEAFSDCFRMAERHCGMYWNG